MDFDDRKVSYLHARDPSVLLSWGPRLDIIKCNLAPLLDISEEDKSKQVHVYLRLKKSALMDLYTYTDTMLVCNVPDSSAAVKHIREGEKLTRKFTFSRIFPPDANQKDLFEGIVKPRVLNFINGSNSTLLTYGASGSGKTFTIVGTPMEPGVIPRVLEYLFRTLPKMPDLPRAKPKDNGMFQWLSDHDNKSEKEALHNLFNHPSVSSGTQQQINTYREMQKRLSNEPVAVIETCQAVSIGIWVSFAEIYNEHVFDLLEWEPSNGKGRPKLKICNNKGATYIQGLKNIYVPSGLEAYQVLQFGLHNLNYAATSVNSHSSRSHCIFTIKLVQAQSETEIVMNHFNFCDLAGSERSKKTHNKGERLKESNNINTSLLVLGKCISIIRSSQKSNEKKRVPFRESKLTQLFQKALTGYEDISMIVNVNPTQDMFDENMHVLNFSAIAKDIVIEAPQLEKLKRKHESSSDNDSEEIERLRRTVSEIYDELQTVKSQNVMIEDETRQELVIEFEKILTSEKEYWKKQLKTLQGEYDVLKQTNINLMDEIKQLKVEEPQAKRPRLESQYEENSVICLESSAEADSLSIDSSDISASD